jgi:hypothetical protein
MSVTILNGFKEREKGKEVGMQQEEKCKEDSWRISWKI